MSVEENMQVVRRWFEEVWNQGKIETIHELLAPDAITKGQTFTKEEIRGPKEFEAFVRQINAVFANQQIKIEDIFGAGDKVVARWSATMTHKDNGLGVPATNKVVRITGTSIGRIVDGKIVEGWDNWDQLGLLEQIGAYTPSMTQELPKSA